ncbi:hypothetical protein M5K25_024344 [Dendrobium thyrsiflorum]|uniref:Uncharacterized protein n=1 Tax=Dendrobium thyrsiflorum TaxID=117978 RepID=A0ABD0U1Q5_DENTH
MHAIDGIRLEMLVQIGDGPADRGGSQLGTVADVGSGRVDVGARGWTVSVQWWRQESIWRVIVRTEMARLGRRQARRSEFDHRIERLDETNPTSLRTQNFDISKLENYPSNCPYARDSTSAVHSNHSPFTLDFSPIYKPCHSRKPINRAPFLLQKGPKFEGIKREIGDCSCPFAPPRPPPEFCRTTAGPPPEGPTSCRTTTCRPDVLPDHHLKARHPARPPPEGPTVPPGHHLKARRPTGPPPEARRSTRHPLDTRVPPDHHLKARHSAESPPEARCSADHHQRPDVLPDHHQRPDVLPDHHQRPDVLPDHHLRPDVLPDHHLRLDVLPDHHQRPDVLPDNNLTPDVLPDIHLTPDVLPDIHLMPDILPDIRLTPDVPSNHRLTDSTSAVHSNHSPFTLDFSPIYKPCHFRKSINRASFLLEKGPKLEGIKREIGDCFFPFAPPRPPPEFCQTTAGPPPEGPTPDVLPDHHLKARRSAGHPLDAIVPPDHHLKVRHPAGPLPEARCSAGHPLDARVPTDHHLKARRSTRPPHEARHSAGPQPEARRSTRPPTEARHSARPPPEA